MSLPALFSWLAALDPAVASLLFVGLYASAAVAMVPGSLLTLAAGAMFGLWWGVSVVFVGAVLGASIAFGVARTIGRRFVARRLEQDARVRAISDAVARQGTIVVLLLRLSPVVPFNLLNYALGLTPVRFRDFLWGSLGMLPGTFFFTYAGVVVGDVTRLAVGASPPRGPAYYVLLALGGAATIALIVLLSRMARTALHLPQHGGD